MDGRHPEAIRIAATSLTDPARVAEFNRWYDTVHLPDILAARVATHATRFENADPQPDEPTYLALYELGSSNLEAVDAAFAQLVGRLREQGRMYDALRILRRSMWKRIGGRFSIERTGRAGTAGIFIIESSCSAPEQEPRFNDWYDHTHIPDLLETGLFHAAHRFVARSGQAGGKYLAIYETATDPLEAVNQFSRSHRPRLKAAGRLSDIIDITWRGIYRRLGATRS